MKRLLLILILTFSFQSWAMADDIRDFEIEGMSIGDSLLDFYSEEKIKQSLIADYPNSDKYKRVQILKHKSFKTYDAMHILYLKTDKKLIIHSLNGMKDYINNINACLKKKDVVLEEIKDLFQNNKIEHKGKRKNSNDKSGTSFLHTTNIKLMNGHNIEIACYEWSKKMKFKNHLRIGIHNKDFLYWQRNEAYK